MTEQHLPSSFSDFYHIYCDDETPVPVTIGDAQADATDLFLYGQLADDQRILVMRTGLHKANVFHWLATFSATTNETVVYEPVTEIMSGRETDHRVAASYGMNAAYLHLENIKALDGRHTASLYLSSHAIRWHDDAGEQAVSTPPTI